MSAPPRFVLRHPRLPPEQRKQQENTEDLLAGLNEIAQFVFFGVGAPTFTPPGRALYIRLDGGAGTTLYVHEGGGWVGK